MKCLSSEGVAAVARVLTAPHLAAGRTRHAAGLGAACGSAALLVLVLARMGSQPAQVGAAGLAAAFAFFAVAQLARAGRRRLQARREQHLFMGLHMVLPRDWYLLGDLQLPSATGDRVSAWAVVAAPGGLVVIQMCSEHGHFFPAGPVWVVEQGRSARVIPSPAHQAFQAATAVRDLLILDPEVPVWPLVVLTDPRGVYHPVRNGGLVVGAPHLPEAAIRCGQGQALQPGQLLQAAADLTRYHG
jgi:hypothetical protein